MLESVFATDASDDRLAGVQADLPPLAAREFFQHAVQRGAWARLLSEPQTWFKTHGLLDPESELPGDESFTPHPVWRVLARSVRYRELFSAPARPSTHINH